MTLRDSMIGLMGVALLAAATTVGAQSKGGGKIVCWKDAQGRVVGCGDKVPAEYSGSATKELDKDGNVRKTGESEQDRNKRLAHDKEVAEAKAEEQRRIAAQKRQDDALLNTFSNEKEVDLKRDREIQALNNFITQQTGALKGANERLAEVRKRAETFEKDKKLLPGGVKEDLARAEREKTRIETDIANNEKAKADITMKYAELRKRYVELRGGTTADTAKPAAATPAPAAANPAPTVAAKK